MQPRTIKKTIYFFETVPKYSLFVKGTSNTEILQNMFTKRFPRIGDYSSNDRQVGIEIISFDKHHVFGMFLKKFESSEKNFSIKQNVLSQAKTIIKRSKTEI